MVRQNITQTTSNIPEWAKPYASEALGRAQALSDINQNPYRPYTGQTVAGWTPLEQQGFRNIQQMTPSEQLARATNLAGLAGQQAQNLQYNPYQIQQYLMGPAQQIGTQDYTGANVGQYMSPYMENVVNRQQQGAIRDYQRQLPGLASLATQMGGLGGTRQALMQSEAQRNLSDRLADIEATGSQAAFQNAQQQFNEQQRANFAAQQANQQAYLTSGQANLNALLDVQRQMEAQRQYGADYGLRGIGAQMDVANLMQQLGQTEYGQRAGIANALLGAGAQMRGLEQTQLDKLAENYQNAQIDPYKKIGFFSDIVNQQPASAYSKVEYGPSPNAAGQVANLGLGLGQLFGMGKSGTGD